MAKRFGLYNYQRDVKIIVKSPPSEVTIGLVCLEPVSPRLVGTILSENVVVKSSDFVIKDLNLAYPENLLKGEWIVDGKRGYKVVQLSAKDVTWEGILRSPFD
ncbi:hypothetical protein BLD44_028355 [Mastigocladus laminosus UU774]|nr:hypothetical protein BLD44_028355 [Mastigocladus laminosus UU774]